MLISRHNMQPNTLTRQTYKGKIYVKNIRKNSSRIRNRNWIRNELKVGFEYGSEKNHSRTTTLNAQNTSLLFIEKDLHKVKKRLTINAIFNPSILRPSI
jgi:hypothetical protein